MLNEAMEQVSLSGLDAETVAASQVVAHQVATSEWLGPLAPIALSPFFGLAVLSGSATYGPEWLQERSALFSEDSLLNSPVLFWTMAVLALLTSIPRFTKVSKPIALAAENLETYSAIIILGAVRFLGASSGAAETTVELDVPALQAAGLASMPMDLVMTLFAALNIIVINVVKLCFEFLVMVIPFPSIDALLEIGNKAACSGLMALYMFSPVLATVLNLILLTICAFAFGWCYRRLLFYRDILAGPILAWMMPKWFAQSGTRYRAFTDGKMGGLPKCSPVTIRENADGEIEITGRWLWKSMRETLTKAKPSTTSFLVIAQKTTYVTDDGEFVFAHRRWVQADEKQPTTMPAAAPA